MNYRIANTVWLLSAAFLLLNCSCGGGGGGGGGSDALPSGQTLSGTAARGGPMAGRVVAIRDRRGNSRSGATGTDGKFQIDVGGMSLPFLIRIPDGDRYLYGVANSSGTTNLHPFTDLIIRNWYKVKGRDVKNVFEAAGDMSSPPASSDIATIEAVLRSILKEWYSRTGVALDFNMITSAFDADGTKFDSVLDNTGVRIDDTTGNVTVTTRDPNTWLESTAVSTYISTDLTVPDTNSPSTPAGLTTFTLSTSEIVMVWDDSSDNIGVAGYNIYRNGVKIESIPYALYRDTGLNPDTDYCYQIEAFDAAGNISGRSNQDCSRTFAAPNPQIYPPDPPTNLTVSPVSSSQIDIIWTSSITTAVIGYEVYRDGVKIAVVPSGGLSVSYRDTGLSSATYYCYTVKSMAYFGTTSIATAAACATTPAGVPSAPTGITSQPGDGQVSLSWNQVSGATSYNVYMAAQSGITKSNYNTLEGGMRHEGVAPPYVHTGLINGKTYYFVVTAVNASGESIESQQVSAIPAASP